MAAGKAGPPVGVTRQTISVFQKGRFHLNSSLAFRIARAVRKRVAEMLIYQDFRGVRPLDHLS
jgi:DNA-binding XRE family transcriptional regulator